MEVVRQSNSQTVRIEPELELRSGGEARIYAIADQPDLVAKIYHEYRPEYGRKLEAMLANPPTDPTAAQGHHSIAWPIDLLRLDPGRPVIGYLMPRASNTRPVIDYYNPLTRRQYSPLFNYLYLYRTARNMSAVMHALHARDYVIGDVNESNILVTDTAMITLVDTDSFQVPDPANNTVFHCPVAKAEFTPAELQGKLLTYLERAPQHDRFGLAILVFQLLMEGTHPYSGAYIGEGDPPPYEVRIGAGHFPYGTRDVPYRPLPMAPPIDILPGNIWRLFVQCFQDGSTDPDARPDAETWVVALREAEHNLTTCAGNEQHRYGKHLSECPWCRRTALLGGRDPFPARESVHKSTHLLPGVETQMPLPSAAPPLALSMLGSLAVTPRAPVIIVPNRQASPLVDDTSNPAPSSVPVPVPVPVAAVFRAPMQSAPPPMRVHVPTRSDDSRAGASPGARIVIGALIVAALVGVGAFAMKGRGSSNNGTPPQVAVQPTGANAVTTAPLPTEASPETLKQFNAAVVKGDESTVTSMLAAYPGIANQRKDTGDTPLHFAADYNRAAIAQRLVDAGADVNAVDNDGYSPLRIVSEKGFPDVASVLLQKGADVNAVDKKGWTALHLAAQNGNTSVAKLLLDNAADYTIKEHLGLTPLAVAKREGKASIIDLLRASGATQ